MSNQPHEEAQNAESPEAMITRLSEIYHAQSFTLAAALGLSLLETLSSEHANYDEVVSMTAWSCWRSGNYEDVYRLACLDSMRGTKLSRTLRATLYSFGSSPYRKLPNAQELLTQALDEMPEEEVLTRENSKLIFDHSAQTGEALYHTPESVRKAVETYCVPKAEDSLGQANLLQNAARWNEQRTANEVLQLLEAVGWLELALLKYDPLQLHQSAQVPERSRTPHAHHIAGLYYRMYQLWIKIGNPANARNALMRSVAAWEIARMKDPKNDIFREKAEGNAALLRSLDDTPKA